MRVGIVIDTRDITSAGILKVSPIDSDGQVSQTPIDVVYLSPNVGGGQGLFTIPGDGSYIMYEDAGDSLLRLAKHAQHSDTPYKWVFAGCLTSNLIQRRGESSLSDDKNDADEGNDTQRDPYGRDPFVDNIIIDSGVPEAGNVYADNFLPQQDVWKHKSGHKFVMSHKITDNGRHDNSMLLQNASGKKILIDDGPPDLKMDRITITDEHKNRIVIRTGGDNPDSSTIHTIRNQDYTTEKGSQRMTVMPASKGHQRRDQMGEGDMMDFVAKGNYRMSVEKNILRISHNGNIEERADTGDMNYTASQGAIEIEAANSITLTCGGSTITMTPASIDITSAIINLNGITQVTGGTTTIATGVVLDTHMHTGNLGFPTSPPQ
jgi:phage baseplate assembly protein gpV